MPIETEITFSIPQSAPSIVSLLSQHADSVVRIMRADGLLDVEKWVDPVTGISWEMRYEYPNIVADPKNQSWTVRYFKVTP